MRLQAGGGDLAVAEPGESVQGALDVGEELGAAQRGGQPDGVGLDRPGRRRRRGIRLPGHARLSVYAA